MSIGTEFNAGVSRTYLGSVKSLFKNNIPTITTIARLMVKIILLLTCKIIHLEYYALVIIFYFISLEIV
jgi:hypothetical protein